MTPHEWDQQARAIIAEHPGEVTTVVVTPEEIAAGTVHPIARRLTPERTHRTAGPVLTFPDGLYGTLRWVLAGHDPDGPVAERWR